jgi:hypothetical protein
MAARIVNFVVVLVANRFIFDFPFYLGDFVVGLELCSGA